jgi:hypothetical protein
MIQTTTGLNQNISNNLELVKGADSIIIENDAYTEGYAFASSTPNSELCRTPEYPAGTLRGFMDLRFFFTADTEIDPYTHVLTIHIVEDGIQKVWTTGNTINGELRLEYIDQTQTIGSRIKLWFDPQKKYQIIVKTAPVLDGSYNVILDYIRFELVKHDNPLMNWVNASETIGGDLWCIDAGVDSVTGNGSTSNQVVSITPTYPFKAVYFASLNSFSHINSSQGTLSGGNVNFTIRDTRESALSGTIPVQWLIIGVAELPLVRPL